MIHRQPLSILRRAWRSLLVVAVIASALSAVLPVPPAWAANWYVATTGNDADSCTSLATACRTINAAINKASSGDVINITAGVYFENINLSKNLSLTGSGQAVTIIDGSGIGPVILITSDSAGTTANLSELTLQNGEYGLGGGLHSESGTGVVTVSNSRIINNVAFTGGGGIFSQGNLKLIAVLIENNVNNGTQRGGGLFNLGSATLTNVSIISNTSNLGGGIGNTGALTLTASIVNNNQADEGGGVYNAGSGAQFISSNNTYLGNHAGSAGGAIYNATTTIDTGSVITGSQAATSGGGIYNTSTGQLTLNGTTLRNNRASSAFGGGLYTDGLSTLTGVTVRGNTATGNGGGIYSAGNSGSLSLADTIVADNRAAANGGGIYAAGLNGVLTLVNSQIIDNQSDVFGGGLYSNIAANLAAVSVSNNRAGSGGGGIYHAGRQISISRSTLANNQALAGSGGGLSNNATATLNEVTLQNNQSDNGGGLYNYSSGQLSAANSTWYLNSATLRGGGLHNQGTLTLTQSTVYSNTTVSQGGGGLYNGSAASAQLVNVTLSYNTVLSSTTGAILNEGGAVTVLNGTISHNAAPALAHTGGSIALANTIIAASIGGVNCNSPVTSNGHNLDSGTSCGLAATGDINNTDPLLGPLVNNGGATLTRVLMSNSPALDAGDDGACPPIDQRGVARPQGDHCDIGAYEVIGFTNTTPGPIAAGSCITSSTDVPNSLIVGSLQIGANVTFQPRGDLRIKLYSPGQRISQLLAATGGSGQNLDVLWDDSASDPVGTEDHDPAFPYYDLTRHPDQPLSVMSGASLHGLWKLEICNVGANTGMLNRWSLIAPSIGNPKVFLPLVRR